MTRLPPADDAFKPADGAGADVARRTRRSVKNPHSPQGKALADAKRALDRHRDSIGDARRTLGANLEGARDTLRTYKAPLQDAVEGRRDGLGHEMQTNDRFDAALVAAKKQAKRPHSARGPSKDM